ncbi:MAG: LD-carboxypeptidase [Desulfobacteraceae bacterium]
MKREVKNTVKPVRPGGTIGVCAPSGSFDLQSFRDGIVVLERMGFSIYIPDTIYSRARYLAGDDFTRGATLNRLYSDKRVDAIICARGGYGSMRVLEYLDWEMVRACAKPFVGFSDTTAILVQMVERLIPGVIHGPVVTSLAGATERTCRSLVNALAGSTDPVEMSSPVVLSNGRARGLLSGGNLATICHLAGTRFQPSFFGCILFLEDISEPPYKIDRMLTQLRMAGCFDGVKGVMAGSFENCSSGEMVHEILKEAFEEYDVPVMAGMDAGHGPDNLSLPFGTTVEMDTETGVLQFPGGE